MLMGDLNTHINSDDCDFIYNDDDKILVFFFSMSEQLVIIRSIFFLSISEQLVIIRSIFFLSISEQLVIIRSIFFFSMSEQLVIIRSIFACQLQLCEKYGVR
jgi:hypothetical protein